MLKGRRKRGIFMEITDNRQIYNILQNLSNLEISYLEYSRQPKNFVKYETYLDFFQNYIIKNHNLSRFYFPKFTSLREEIPELEEKYLSNPTFISEIEELPDYFSVISGYDFSVCKSFNFPNPLRHKCNYFTGIYLLEGKGTLIMDHQTFTINIGDFFLIPPEVYYALQTEPESICIYFDLRRSFIAAEYKTIFQEHPLLTRFIAKSLASDSTMTYLVLHTSGSDKINDLVLTIFAEYINQDIYSNNAMKNILALLFVLILRDEKTTMESSVEVTRVDQQYQQVIDYLKQNYQSATLSSAAEHIHFSKQYLCKIVKQKTGDTFNTLLNQIRLKMVEQYLSETDLTLETISELCGFASAPHLSRVFKSQYGVSPSVYKKNLLQS